MHEMVLHPLFGMVLFNLLIVWPVGRILRRAGLQPWWALMVFVPLIGFMLVVALLGHARWPNLPARPAPPPRKARRSA